MRWPLAVVLGPLERRLAAAQEAVTGGASERPPNIVLIVSDDQGYGDVSAFGGDIRTPNIDAIARGGARLLRFYTASPVCTPSRYAMLSGRYPSARRADSRASDDAEPEAGGPRVSCG